MATPEEQVQQGQEQQSVQPAKTQSKQKIRSALEAVQSIGSAPTPYMMGYEAVDPKRVQEIKDRYAINPDETALAYFSRTTAKPKEIDEKAEKRNRLFGAIADAAMLLGDSIGVAKGGLAPVRTKSALGVANAAIEAERKRNATELLAYRTAMQKALKDDRDAEHKARTAVAKALDDYYDGINTRNAAAKRFNYNAVNKFSADAYDTAVKAAINDVNNEHRAGENAKNRATQWGIAKMREEGANNRAKLYGNKNGNSDESQSTLVLRDKNGENPLTLHYPNPKDKNEYHSALRSIITGLKAKEDEMTRRWSSMSEEEKAANPDAKPSELFQAQYYQWSLTNQGLTPANVEALIQESNYLKTAEGRQWIQQQLAPYQDEINLE